MVPTPPRSVRTVVTDLRMAERITPGLNKVVPDPKMTERINPSPNMIMTDPRTAEKVCMGPQKVAMGPRITRMVAMRNVPALDHPRHQQHSVLCLIVYTPCN